MLITSCFVSFKKFAFLSNFIVLMINKNNEKFGKLINQKSYDS